MENANSNLEFGGWNIWGGKSYLEFRIWAVENLGWKMLSRISNLGGGWKIWGGKCFIESRIWGVEKFGWKMLSRTSNLWGGKFGVENAISNLEFGGRKFVVENAISNLEK